MTENLDKPFNVQYALDNERRMTRIEGKIDSIVQSQTEMAKVFEDHIRFQADRDKGQDEEIVKNRDEFFNAIKWILGSSVTAIGTMAWYFLTK